MTLDHRIQWVTASPLWQGHQNDGASLRRPALLRFASDNFMEDLAARLATLDTRQPQSLHNLVAQPESFRARPTGKPLGWTPPPPPQLKLYQPAHGHFYLVAAQLVCRITGMPDRFVDTAKGEQVGFVLRRLVRKADGTRSELAWTVDPVKGKGWAALPSGKERTLAEAEELLPLFPVNFRQDDRRRRLLVGLVPTSSRDTFVAAPTLSPIVGENRPGTDQPLDPRLDQFGSRVVGPLDALMAQERITTPTGSQTEAEKFLVARQREGSLFVLLDFAEMLDTYLPNVWQGLIDVPQRVPGVGAPARALYDWLNSRKADGATTWLKAMTDAWAQRDRITEEAEPAADLGYNLRHSDLPNDEAARRAQLDVLESALETAFGSYTPPAPALSPIPVPKLDARPETLYNLRCVFRRTRCPGLCPDEVSEPTEAFTIAPFFDFDAPNRPIRITMPVDTSIAGLRKFNKNVAFQISDKLRAQMNAVTDFKKALDGGLAAGTEFDLGVICSFSIPIITICALIVLLIFVYLLNIVFWWIPFFRICLPIGLKAKD